MPAFDGGVEIDPARPRLPAELRVRFDVVCRLGAPDGVPQTFPLAQVDDTVSCEAVTRILETPQTRSPKCPG